MPFLKRSLIGREEEVPRLLRDNAFTFGFERGSRGGKQKQASGKKCWEEITACGVSGYPNGRRGR